MVFPKHDFQDEVPSDRSGLGGWAKCVLRSLMDGKELGFSITLGSVERSTLRAFGPYRQKIIVARAKKRSLAANKEGTRATSRVRMEAKGYEQPGALIP